LNLLGQTSAVVQLATFSQGNESYESSSVEPVWRHRWIGLFTGCLDQDKC